MELCVIWGGEKWNENSAKAKLNRVAHPEANVHTSGSVSFATHKVRLTVSQTLAQLGFLGDRAPPTHQPP
ncbi:hypothetical protein Taro_043244, partial [Colocasia esculenta]|nr:hypothetical protein [Colocasia esculenta]